MVPFPSRSAPFADIGLERENYISESKAAPAAAFIMTATVNASLNIRDESLRLIRLTPSV
ncbi:hypothetical protein MHB85_17185 [Paenibacillus sp. FSL K6-4396]|uniref:hypothetical protein n=1 Tax=unclassified Paenibacillus TaxID=185978 RepID=UPI001783F547|nr:hypothetical protein [Paenibacillus sp. CFBP 13594]MBD8836747.1 hypothetical protein [Paenibacillus sp. CFBP 13594]